MSFKESEPNRHELNKKILVRSPRHREKEQLGPNGRYRDEDYAIYTAARAKFLEAAKRYNRLNKETLIVNKKRLHQDYVLELNCDFLNVDNKIIQGCANDCKCPPYPNRAIYTKKRTSRLIHTKPPEDSKICCIESWLKRGIVLGRFIKAARKIIVRNRLEKALEAFRQLDKDTINELELKHRKCYNESYADLFEIFM